METVTHSERLRNMPYGFFPFPQRNGENWCIYFKFHTQSMATIVQINLSQKQAQSKANAFNSTLVGNNGN